MLPVVAAVALKMKPKANGVPRAQMSKVYQGEGPNWILIAGGALLSTLSMRLGYKLKQVLDTKQMENSSNDSKGRVICKHSLIIFIVEWLFLTRVNNAGSRKSTESKKTGNGRLHSDVYCFTQHDDGCFNCMSGGNLLDPQSLALKG